LTYIKTQQQATAHNKAVKKTKACPMSAQVYQFSTNSLPTLFKQFDVPGPRYTSYPTIDHASESIDAQAYSSALKGRELGGLRKPLSLYVHVPFCESICYYCACNKIITKHHDQVESYIKLLEAETHWVAEQSRLRGPVTQLHFGGGTPTFMSDVQLSDLIALLWKHFDFAQNAEISIEIDPRTVNATRLKNLREMGFNRISFGVQDFDPAVQKAVHREQSVDSIFELMGNANLLSFESTNVDLIYGLPLQTLESFAQTLDTLVKLSPSRIALYGYAHLPNRFKPQRRILDADLPDAHTRLALLAMAIDVLGKAGYDYIGMDHFAKPSDSLSKAKRQGLLHRNFQGYTTQPDTDLIGLGVSAISKVGTTLVQNSRDIEEYRDAIEHVGCAVFRGFVSEKDDLARQWVIMRLLCQGSVIFEDFQHTHWLRFEEYFAKEMPLLLPFVRSGLLNLNECEMNVTPTGWFFIRHIAMCFDRYVALSKIERSRVL
jgi:oxygen-independent coproporphyrinogen-3 oxidase